MEVTVGDWTLPPSLAEVSETGLRCIGEEVCKVQLSV